VKLEGEHLFGVEPERVWEALHDPRVLSSAVAGLKRLDARGGDEYALTVRVGVAP
jgi:carbon monoxide dehydrogenase subunit G